ncbi:MAG TPA: sensor histidine kinase [Flavobacteriales bacterium]|nr:sensor histidine kinase [Flavobacteriales bacterium]
MFGIMTAIEFFGSLQNFYLDGFCFLLSLGFLLFLLKTKNYKPIYLIGSFSITIICFFSLNNFLHDTHHAVFLWMIYAVMLAYWGVGLTAGAAMLGLNIFSALYYHVYSLEMNVSSLRTIDAGVKTALIVEIVVVMLAIALLLYQFVNNYRISLSKLSDVNEELKEANAMLSAKNAENVLLLKEVHHRVKNNLQIIISLLRLQSGGLPKESMERFDDAINRILTMALIHRKLYQSSDLSVIEIEAYVRDLVSGLTDKETIKLTVDSEVKNFGLKTIVPLGLMLNELLSNSYKHAFKEKESGEIILRIRTHGTDAFLLEYSDSGIWIESEASSERFGLNLIETLTEQMEGSIERKGSSYVFKLKNLDI